MSNSRSWSQIKQKLHSQEATNFAAALSTGLMTASVFHMFDRANYLSVTNNRAFFNVENFQQPLRGITQSLIHKGSTTLVYCFMQAELTAYFLPNKEAMSTQQQLFAQFAVGAGAGAITGIITNPIAAAKYGRWNNNYGMDKSSWKHMRNITKGMAPTIFRDVAFAVPYEVIRRNLMQWLMLDSDGVARHEEKKLVCNAVAAAIGTVIAAPFQYARFQQYKTPPEAKAPSIKQSLQAVATQVKQETTNPLKRVSKAYSQHFKVGYGIWRVAAGMAITQTVFDATRKKLNSK